MKNQLFKKVLTGTALLATVATINGCSGGGGSSTYGVYSSPYISANSFVSGLNNTDGALYNSYVEKYTDETIRSEDPFEDAWFVIRDDKMGEYKAVNLDYIRTIAYYDYYANSTGLAEEFRDREESDIFAGDLFGDFFGEEYETVVYVGIDSLTGLPAYQGVNSLELYEGENESKDVATLNGETEFAKRADKAARVAFEFNTTIQMGFSLVSLSDKIEVLKKDGEFSLDDQKVVLTDLEHFTGKTLEEAMEAGKTEKGKNQIIGEIAKKLEMSAQTIESKVMPMLNIK